MIDLIGVYQHAKFLGLCCCCSVITKGSKFLNLVFLMFYLSECFLMSKDRMLSWRAFQWHLFHGHSSNISRDMDVRVFRVCRKLKTLDNHNSETLWQIKKKICPKFSLDDHNWFPKFQRNPGDWCSPCGYTWGGFSRKIIEHLVPLEQKLWRHM